jgi:dipeptidyl aminopeptidase/acylaminoacyl peptidase
MTTKTRALAVTFLVFARPTLATTIHQYSDLAISQDGSRTATIEPTTASNDHQSVIERSTRDGHALVRIDPCRTCSYADPAFGPDGRVAFLAHDSASESVTLETGFGEDVHAVATIHGIASAPRFSPDGRRIALLVTMGARKQAGATSPGARMIGEIGDHQDERRIAVFDVDSSAAAIEPVSPSGRYIYEYDWTPDGKGFVATTALGNGDDNWWVATLDAIDAKTGAVREIAAPRTQMNYPRGSLPMVGQWRLSGD